MQQYKILVVKNVSNPLGGINSPGSPSTMCSTLNLQFFCFKLGLILLIQLIILIVRWFSVFTIKSKSIK
jgi:hypothetical protein